MAGARDFTELRMWQSARELSKEIFQLTKRAPFKSDRRLVEQVNDSSASTMANIAEGFGRGTQGEFVQFLGYALASADETRSHLCAAFDREYVTREEFDRHFGTGLSIRKMIVKFVGSMVMPGSGVKNLRKPGPSWTDEVWEMYERITGRGRPELFRIHGERTRGR